MEELTVEVSGLALRCRSAGTGGPAVVLVHGMASGGRPWAGAVEAIARGGRRGVAYDRRGYGHSGAPEPYLGTTVEEQAEDLAGVLVGPALAPAVLVGDGFGGLVVLDVLKRHRALAAGAVLRDVPLFAFVPEATEEISRERAELETALRERGKAGAVEVWLGPQASPEELAWGADHAGAFFADYAGLSSWSVTRRELRALDAPAVVATSPGAAPHVVAAADALVGLLPDVRRETEVADLVPLALAL